MTTEILETATSQDKQFLSALTESAAAGTYSVRTATEDGVLTIDSAITLVNGQGVGTVFTFGHAEDLLDDSQDVFNQYECIHEMQRDADALMAFVLAWHMETSDATAAFDAAVCTSL